MESLPPKVTFAHHAVPSLITAYCGWLVMSNTSPVLLKLSGKT